MGFGGHLDHLPFLSCKTRTQNYTEVMPVEPMDLGEVLQFFGEVRGVIGKKTEALST